MLCYALSGIIILLVAYIVVLRLSNNKKSESPARPDDDVKRLIYIEKMASLGMLVAGIAHEINNPLTFLITNLSLFPGYVENVISAGPDKESQNKKLEEMKNLLDDCGDGAERIKRIVKDLLVFAHAASDKKTLTDVNQLLEATVRVLWNEIKYKVALVKDYKAVAQILIDTGQLSQVFLTLLINATQAIKEKGTITVSTREDDKNIIITIADTGCGIPQDVLGKIFDPFFTTKNGTGLGLYVSRQIITSYRGAIDAKSEIDKGATFNITLPKQSEGADQYGKT